MPPERGLDLAALCESYETRLGMAMDYAEARCDVCSGSRLFSSSGVGCQAFRDVAAGFAVLSAVGAVPSA